MYLIQLLLPLHDNDKQQFPPEYFEAVRHRLADQFGGVTAFVRAPAMGLWKEADDVSRDEVLMFEVLATSMVKLQVRKEATHPLVRRGRCPLPDCSVYPEVSCCPAGS